MSEATIHRQAQSMDFTGHQLTLEARIVNGSLVWVSTVDGRPGPIIACHQSHGVAPTILEQRTCIGQLLEGIARKWDAQA